jgi:hypothetical protein
MNKKYHIPAADPSTATLFQLFSNF